MSTDVNIMLLEANHIKRGSYLFHRGLYHINRALNHVDRGLYHASRD